MRCSEGSDDCRPGQRPSGTAYRSNQLDVSKQPADQRKQPGGSALSARAGSISQPALTGMALVLPVAIITQHLQANTSW